MSLLSRLSSMSQNFRARRMAAFEREMQPHPGVSILDVGGRPQTWEGSPFQSRVVILNDPRDADAFGDPRCLGGDGCALPFADQSFDIVFSNSVIEHVGSPERQRQFAAEIARVGKRYWVQTPNRGFPVEQHLFTPFLHWLPASLKRWVAPRFTVWAVVSGASKDRRDWYVQHFLNDIRLLNAADLALLFPGARIIRESFCGMSKSLIAIR